ncbi:MAG TPA: 5'-nucleotidase [Bacteroidales bacterium]|nr:5'-nucleotidase [Bacteroidales bacterium]
MVKNHWVFFALLACILVVPTACHRGELQQSISGQLAVIDSAHVPHPDPTVDSIVTVYRGKLGEEMNLVLAASAQPMRRDSPEGLLNNFVADIVFGIAREKYEPSDGLPIDFCLLNYGGLRASLPLGPVTMGNVYELMPFENEIMIITLSGQKTWELFQYLAASRFGMPVSGINLTIRDKKPIKVLIQGKPFDLNRNYKIATSDFLAQGGDQMNFFLNPVNSHIVGIRVREAIILYMQSQQALGRKLTSSLDGRITILE